jgi:hypothetical protein
MRYGDAMRTTIDLNDLLLEQARSIAAAEGVPLRAVLDDALRLLVLDRQRGASAARPPTGPGLWPTIDYAHPVAPHGSADTDTTDDATDPQDIDDLDRIRALHGVRAP